MKRFTSKIGASKGVAGSRIWLQGARLVEAGFKPGNTFYAQWAKGRLEDGGRAHAGDEAAPPPEDSGEDRRRIMTTVYLQSSTGSLCVAAFAPAGSSGPVTVTAILGAVSYIDRVMSREEARAVWADLIARGWQLTATPRHDVVSLRHHIYN